MISWTTSLKLRGSQNKQIKIHEWGKGLLGGKEKLKEMRGRENNQCVCVWLLRVFLVKETNL